MAVTVVEQFGRAFDGTSASKVYYLHNATDEDDARTALLSAAAATWEAGGKTLYLDEDGSRVYENDGVWYGELSYVPLGEGTGEDADSSFEFDTTGGTQHLMASTGTVAAYGTGASTTDYGSLIGCTRDGVEGVDVGVGQLGFTITKSFDVADVDSDFIEALRDAAFTTNDDDFSGTTDDGVDFFFNLGEVLFQGCRGGVRNGRMVITFYFAAASHLVGATIAGITDVYKAAWDYLWIRYQDAVVGTTFTKTPIAIYVEAVYYFSDFSLLEIL